MDETVEIKETQPCQRELTITVPAEVMERELDSIYGQFRQSRRIPGFRLGKAPRAVLERRFGKEAHTEALRNRIAASYSRVLKEKGLNVIGDPTFRELEWEEKQPFIFKATVDVKPVVGLKNYKGLRLQKKRLRVEEKEVEQALETLRERVASFEVVEGRGLEEGDYALVDYRPARDEGEQWGENWFIEIKSGSPDGLARQLLGMKPGEVRTVKAKAVVPSGSSGNSGQEMELAIKLREIKKKNLPEMDDSLASHWGDFKNLEEVRAKLRETILLQKKAETRRYLEEQIISSLLQKHSFPLPPSVLARLETDYFNELRHYAQEISRGKGKADVEESLRKEAREKAEKYLGVMFVLGEIAHQEGLEVEPRMLGEEIRRLAQQQRLDPAEYRQRLEESGEVLVLKNRLLRQRVMDFLISQAKIKESG